MIRYGSNQRKIQAKKAALKSEQRALRRDNYVFLKGGWVPAEWLLSPEREPELETYGPPDERTFDDRVNAAIRRYEIEASGGELNWELSNDESLLPPLSLMRAVILQARPH